MIAKTMNMCALTEEMYYAMFPCKMEDEGLSTTYKIMRTLYDYMANCSTPEERCDILKRVIPAFGMIIRGEDEVIMACDIEETNIVDWPESNKPHIIVDRLQKWLKLCTINGRQEYAFEFLNIVYMLIIWDPDLKKRLEDEFQRNVGDEETCCRSVLKTSFIESFDDYFRDEKKMQGAGHGDERDEEDTMLEEIYDSEPENPDASYVQELPDNFDKDVDIL